MAEINEYNERGLQTPYTQGSAYNNITYIVERELAKISTAFIGRIDGCTNDDSSVKGSGKVNSTPLSAQSDAENNALPMSSIQALPYARYQSGIAAVIIEPAPGDQRIFVTCKNDISTIQTGTTDPQRPGSNRKFSQSDSVCLGSINTKVPEVYIFIKQDKTLLIHAPEGVTIETDADCTITCGGNLKATVSGTTTIDCEQTIITGALTVQGGLTVTGGNGATVQGNINSQGGDIKADNISLKSHVHGNVQNGGGITSSAQ